MLLHYLGKLKLLKISADIEEKQTNCIFDRIYLCYSSTNFDIFGV